MATAKRKSAARKQGGSARRKQQGGRGSSKQTSVKCGNNDVCDYLTKLNAWLLWFIADYEKLRIAVCNVEKQAFSGNGTQGARFCSGGPGNQPAAPTQPPAWY